MRSISFQAARRKAVRVWQNGAYRLLRYTVLRAITLSFTVAIAVYLTILIANFGGNIDTFVKADIDFRVGGSMRYLKDVTLEEKAEIFEQRTAAAYEAAGLNTPFVARSFRWLQRGLLLDWGSLHRHTPGQSSGDGLPIRETISRALPRSLLVFGTANLFLFLTVVLIALTLANRKYGWADRLIAMLAPLSAIPAWVYGIVLNLLILRTVWGVVGDRLAHATPAAFRLSNMLELLQSFILPFACIFLSGLFQGLYMWRAYFQLHANEEYVELGRAKGLPPRLLERRYILRPMLPSLITSFALLFVELWQQVIVLEHVFGVPGVGRLFMQMLDYRVANRTPYIVALVVTFAYLLAATVFVLDIIYVIVDPRIKFGNPEFTVSARATGRRMRRRRSRKGPRLATSIPTTSSRVNLNPTAVPTRLTSVAGVTERMRSVVSRLQRIGPKRLWQRHTSQVAEGVQRAWRGLSGSPSALVGLAIIMGMGAIAIYTLLTIPYSEMLVLWREGEELWLLNPKDAAPAWTNFFRKDKLPPTVVIESASPSASRKGFTRSVEAVAEGMSEITLSFPFEFTYSTLPQDVSVIIDAQYHEKRPLVMLTWTTPDGREIELLHSSMEGRRLMYRVSQDQTLSRRFRTQNVLPVLFSDPERPESTLQSGTYELQLTAYVFEEDTNIDARFMVYGHVFGLSGTDGRRRDLKVPLLWGMVMALSFGIVAAITTTLSSIVIAAVGTWMGGWIDALVQRITEVNLILPFLPVSVMIYVLYSKSFWVILGVTVGLTIFGPSIKAYRALFLQIRESPYVEAAKAYGASHRRIIFRYLIPRVASVAIPRLIILVPSYVFLEATLAMLGVSDPVLPTWGKLVLEALSRGLKLGNYYLVAQPLALLLLVGFAFALLGLSLERVLKPHEATR